MLRQQLRGLLLVLFACSVITAALASGLRPDTFFVGDPGVKLISTRNTLRTPASPLNIPLPHIGTDQVPHVEQFFAVHDTHAHAVTSEFFPLVTAPLLRLLGLRGIYVLPALGFLATLAGTAWLGWVLDHRRNMAHVAGVAALGSPFLFYGLEFWEHMPAVALLVCGTALLFHATRRQPGGHAATLPTFAAGLLFGAATTFRPEAACFVAAVFVASRLLIHRPSWRSLAVATAGMVVGLLPLEAYTVVHFGSWIPGHVGTNAALFGDAWLAERATFASNWLLPAPWTGRGPTRLDSFWSVAPAAVVAAGGLFRASNHDERPFLWTVAVLTIGLTLLVAPNDGGGQWAPRYLLPAYVPLVLLAADTIQALPRTVWAIALIVVLAAGGVWVQRAAYRTLRGAKNTYGRLADAVERLSSPGLPVITDVWWLDQLAAAALDDRNVLVAADPSAGRDIVRRFSDLVSPSVTVVRSHEIQGGVDAWNTGTCYFEEAREEVDVRGVVVYRLRHRCGHTDGNR